MRRLMQEAKDAGLWALGHPVEIGGGRACRSSTTSTSTRWSGRSEHAMVALGTHSLQDSIMLNLHAAPEWRERYLKPLVAGEMFPSFGMTEPEVASSDPTQLQTRGRARRRRLGDQRPQVVHHRGEPRRLHDRHVRTEPTTPPTTRRSA